MSRKFYFPQSNSVSQHSFDSFHPFMVVEHFFGTAYYSLLVHKRQVKKLVALRLGTYGLTQNQYTYLDSFAECEDLVLKEFFCVSDAQTFVGEVLGVVVVVELAVSSSPLAVVVDVLKPKC